MLHLHTDVPLRGENFKTIELPESTVQILPWGSIRTL